MSFTQANPPDLAFIAHRGLLPGKGSTPTPEAVTALRSTGVGVLGWRQLGASPALEVTVTWTRLLQEVTLGLTSGAFQGAELRPEGEHEVVDGHFAFDEGDVHLVARLPIDVPVPEWAE